MLKAIRSFSLNLFVPFFLQKGRIDVELSSPTTQYQGAGSDAALSASLAAMPFFSGPSFNAEPLLRLALAEGSSEVRQAALSALAPCVLRGSCSAKVAARLL